MLSEERANDLVSRILQVCQQNRIVLFGSAADAAVTSPGDIDLLVVVKDGVHRRQTAQRIYRGLLGFGTPVDVVVATVSDIDLYRDSPSLVYRDAIARGRNLYAA